MQVDPDLKKLGAASRVRRYAFEDAVKQSSAVSSCEIDRRTPRSPINSSAKGISRFHTSPSSVSPPSKIVHLSTNESLDIDCTPK